MYSFPYASKLSSVIHYFCMNSECPCHETLLFDTDVVFDEAWCEDNREFTLLPHCPSCCEVCRCEVDDRYRRS